MKALIIEDEVYCQDLLINMIPLITEEIEVVGSAIGVSDGINLIQEEKPDVIFLDIELKDGSGFDLLNQLANINFFTIFVTSYENYALKAIKYAPIDYILKPVLPSDLGRALQKVLQKKEEHPNSKIEKISDNYSVLSNGIEYRVTNNDEILYIEADRHYCEVKLENGNRIVTSETLSNFEGKLPKYFFRLHKSILVNLKKVKSFQLKSTPTLVLSNDVELNIAHRRKKEFELAIQQLFRKGG